MTMQRTMDMCQQNLMTHAGSRSRRLDPHQLPRPQGSRTKPKSRGSVGSFGSRRRAFSQRSATRTVLHAALLRVTVAVPRMDTAIARYVSTIATTKLHHKRCRSVVSMRRAQPSSITRSSRHRPRLTRMPHATVVPAFTTQIRAHGICAVLG